MPIHVKDAKLPRSNDSEAQDLVERILLTNAEMLYGRFSCPSRDHTMTNLAFPMLIVIWLGLFYPLSLGDNLSPTRQIEACLDGLIQYT